MVIQKKDRGYSPGDLPLAIAHGRPIPELRSDRDVLIRILAVGLNPVDCKMVSHFFMEGKPVGCDFCGVVEMAGSASQIPVGSRVIAGELPYRMDNDNNGAFAQYAVADCSHTIIVPDDWSDTLAAGLGNLSWATVGLAMSKVDALGLTGTPSHPAEKALPVLVYGGGTATGIIAIQMLKRFVNRSMFQSKLQLRLFPSPESLADDSSQIGICPNRRVLREIGRAGYFVRRDWHSVVYVARLHQSNPETCRRCADQARIGLHHAARLSRGLLRGACEAGSTVCMPRGLSRSLAAATLRQGQRDHGLRAAWVRRRPG